MLELRRPSRTLRSRAPRFPQPPARPQEAAKSAKSRSSRNWPTGSQSASSPSPQRRKSRDLIAIGVGVHGPGGNTRRIRKALEPLLGSKHLSKSAVSRVVSRLKDLFAVWSERDLSEESFPILGATHLELSLPTEAIEGQSEEQWRRAGPSFMAIKLF